MEKKNFNDYLKRIKDQSSNNELLEHEDISDLEEDEDFEDDYEEFDEEDEEKDDYEETEVEFEED